MFVVTVTFQIKPKMWDAFLPLMTENAQLSRAYEADCHQFDVCTNPDAPNTVFLYEVYTDRAAFDAHLQSAHFKAFDGAAASMILDKSVSILERIVP